MKTEEEHICEACGNLYDVPSDLEDTGICNLCAQGQIGKLKQELKHVYEVLGEAAIARDEARAACAEMRQALEWLLSDRTKDGWKCHREFLHDPGECSDCDHVYNAQNALSSDCGKGWISPETLRSTLGMNSPWPVTDILQKLANLGDHLTYGHDCDCQGHEIHAEAVKQARAMIEKINLTVAICSAPAHEQKL